MALSETVRDSETLLAAQYKNSDDKTDSRARLLLIVGEPFNDEQKRLILERITSELSTWDSVSSGCCVDEHLGQLATEKLSSAAAATPRNGDVIEYKSDSLTIELLINPRVATTIERIRSFVASASTYRHFLYAGLAVQGNGSWLLQDGTLSFSAFSSVFLEEPCNGSGPVIVATFPEGEWKESNITKLVPGSRLCFNPSKIDTQADKMAKFTESLSAFLNPQSVSELLVPTDMVGSMPFSRPTLYVFAGGNGASALFGVRGFTLLVDGGYGRRSCFWDLTKHLDSIDSLLITQLGPENILGIASFLERKSLEDICPALGPVFLNVGDSRKSLESKPDGKGVERQGLLVDLAKEGESITDWLCSLDVCPRPCVASPTGLPVNLLHNVGYGSLDMYVLNPPGDSKELKEFLANWGKIGKTSPKFLNQLSISAIVVFRPFCQGERPTRILFPGATPQSKLFEGLDKLKAVTLFLSESGTDKAAVAASKAGLTKASTSGSALRPAASAGSRVSPAPAGRVGMKSTTKPAVGADASKKDTSLSKPRIQAGDEKVEQKKFASSVDPHKMEARKMTAVGQKDAKKPAAKTTKPSAENKDTKQAAGRVAREAKKSAAETRDTKPTTSVSSPRSSAAKTVAKAEQSPGVKVSGVTKSKKVEAAGKKPPSQKLVKASPPDDQKRDLGLAADVESASLLAPSTEGAPVFESPDQSSSAEDTGIDDSIIPELVAAAIDTDEPVGKTKPSEDNEKDIDTTEVEPCTATHEVRQAGEDKLHTEPKKKKVPTATLR